MIVIVDYGLGNLGSVQNMLKKIGRSAQISRNPEEIQAATHLILPGVGAFDHGMAEIRNKNLETVLRSQALERGVPFLGICLGMQLLAERSQEGDSPGLGWIPGRSLSFRERLGPEWKVPHMGWSSIQIQKQHPVLQALPQDSRFYFVHSYFVECQSSDHSLAKSDYGLEFSSIIGRNNILGVQFHPEKSHRFGMTLLKAFTEWDGRA